MAASTSKSEMPTFSYAQAAKGLSATATSQQVKPATEHSGTISQQEESNSIPAAVVNPNTSIQTESSREASESAVDPESKSATTASSKNVVSGTSSPSFGTASTSTLPKEDDISVLPNGTSDSTWDKQSQASVPVEKPNADGEAKKEEPSTPSPEKSSLPKELKAAPIPTVNVWQQRKEAQEAKAKANAATLKLVTTNSTKSTKPATGGLPTSGDASDSSKAGSKKKLADSQSDANVSQGKDRRRPDTGKPREEGSRKSANRFPRPNEESADSALPLVADASAWPTPHIAQGEEKRKAQEKTEKSEKADKSPVIRGKEKWTHVPYVPTAVFNTPLPSGARRGGRPSRGGRDGSRGAAHNVSSNGVTENKSVTGQINPSPLTKQTTVPDRGRNDTNSARANSLPAQARRSASADTGAQADHRRPSQAFDRSRGDVRAKAPEDPHPSANGVQNVIGDATAKSHRDARYSGRLPESAPTYKGADQNSRSGHISTDGHGGTPFSSRHERGFDNALRSGDYRDSLTFVPREREHREFTRDRGEYQRDREHTRERGDSRPERGRGGYRGRGGHSYGGGSQSSHFSSSQLSQNSFIPSKSFGFNDRQRSQQGYQNGTSTSNSNHRLSLRNPSVPNSTGLYGSYPHPEINTMYAAYQPIPSGPMTAIPYPPYMEQFPLIGMIQMQLEYYFSVDNLCKDLYLRKHMDSQGFVLLTFIANFKRIKNLTEDFELLRQCSRQLRNVECQFGEDGVDRLRPREKWEQWVLNMDQRDQSAQNDGPPPPKAYPPADFESYDEHVASSYTNGSVNGFSRTHPHGAPNSTSEHSRPRTSLSSTAPEFTPFVPIESTNVGNSNEPNFFPNDKIENLVIVVRKPEISSSPQQHILNHSLHSLANTPVDNFKTGGGTVTSGNLSILPSSGAPSVLCSSAEENNSRHNNDLSNSLDGDEGSEPRSQMPAFWVKEKNNPVEIPSFDTVHESYNTFRNRALATHGPNAIFDGVHSMDVLYNFWSQFLVHNFNTNMYDEFKNLALDDDRNGDAASGLDRLIRFYNSILLSSITLPDQVVKDLVTFVETEPRTSGRPFFSKLRSAWQSDTFNLHTRQKFEKIVHSDLKVELEM